MNTHAYPHTPFSITWTNANPGGWEKNEVKVFRDGVEIGGYTRNYGMVAKTFCPFQVGEEWYALYSEDYTATRVARLTDKFEDWCGEEPDGAGFCPTAFFVPYGYEMSYVLKGDTRKDVLWFDADYEDDADFAASAKDSPIAWSTFGLLSGCYWGDDSSWKLRYIDLSGIPDKVLKIEEKFGYWELADDIRKSLRMYGYGRIALTGRFAMDLTKRVPNASFAEGFFTEKA